MTIKTHDQNTAMQLLERMFEVEMKFLKSDTKDVKMLAAAFHNDVVVHEPASLPYAGDWQGLEGIGALLRKMGEIWSNVEVEDLAAARTGDTVFMTCTLHLVSRARGTVIKQPFAEVLRFRNGLLLDGTPFYYDTCELAAAV
ncbi:nuclear transport factor 2 family protein [Mesorhizobium sp. RMAD-H1]|uniref:nuclear transport factor 2 family protein n=1 Tax=Mesorhizobium sp. RMAD-H1 TaxID=2587065 RepID=UPI0017DE0A06|nr:nuclear transport factor 2 family protein [Mesorhizobium sp. RMAD-H1]MBB2971131.1 ketosteroid isomerase-like protein [Mesorhizobium sp. RMAD-H1]